MTTGKNTPNRIRLFVDIDIVTLRKLILWSYSRGEKKNGWAKTVITLRCDENAQKVEEWIAKEATRLQVTPAELEQSILKQEGFDFDAYRTELLGSGETE